MLVPLVINTVVAVAPPELPAPRSHLAERARCHVGPTSPVITTMTRCGRRTRQMNERVLLAERFRSSRLRTRRRWSGVIGPQGPARRDQRPPTKAPYKTRD